MNLTAAIAQFAPSEDKTANIDTMIGLLERAAARGAQLVVLPERPQGTIPLPQQAVLRVLDLLLGKLLRHADSLR